MGNKKNTTLFKEKNLVEGVSKCTYCDCTLYWNNCHVDHVIAKSIGGLNTKSNYTLSCNMCNVYKSNMSVVEFYHYLKNRALKHLKIYSRLKERLFDPLEYHPNELINSKLNKERDRILYLIKAHKHTKLKINGGR